MAATFSPRPEDIPAIRAMVASHRGPPVGSSRLGAIVREGRPAWRIDGMPAFGAGTLPDGFDWPGDAQTIGAAAQAAGGCVGRVEARIEGRWTLLGTCFRVGAAGRLVASAGHLLTGLLRPGTQITRGLPFATHPAAGAASGPPLHEARVGFGPEGSFAVRPVSRVVACHPRWDLLIVELADGGGSPALPPPVTLETDPDWGQPTGNKVLVLGHPGLQGASAAGELFEAAYGAGAADGLYVAPGLFARRARSDFLDPLATDFIVASVDGGHEASSLPGFSGGPVVSIETGRVVALHYQPGRFGIEPNRAVNLPIAIEEAYLRTLLVDGTEDGAAPVTWSPDTPTWQADAPGSGEDAWEAADPVTQPLFSGVEPDRPDFRDYPYKVGLASLPDELVPPEAPAVPVRGQGNSRACTGFALATTIDWQLAHLGRDAGPVSARMLYECAQLHDEWIDRKSGGSSLRGAIKGFHQNGVCAEDLAPWDDGAGPWLLTRERARAARGVTLGAYLSLPRDLLAFQSALAETGAVLVSAHIHEGWRKPKGGRIKPSENLVGDHAFVLLGYDGDGFVIQNSWGLRWGRKGRAHWRYEDWAENLIDAWTLRLAPGHPDTFDLRPRVALVRPDPGLPEPSKAPAPRRHTLIGHVVQTEAEGFVESGPLGAGLDALRETALWLSTLKVPSRARKKLTARGRKTYPCLTFVLHDPFLGSDATARIAARLIPPLKARGAYSIHLVHGLSEAETIRLRILSDARTAAERFRTDPEALSIYVARRAQAATLGLWERFRSGLDVAVRRGGPIWTALAAILLEAGRGREARLLAIGAGAEVARALHRAGTLETLGVTPAAVDCLAPTLSGQDVLGLGGRCVAWRSGPASIPSATIPGYRGDWPDLLVAAYGGGPQVVPPDIPVLSSPLATALDDPQLLKRLVQAFG